jgi:signal transduction histidine kinase
MSHTLTPRIAIGWVMRAARLGIARRAASARKACLVRPNATREPGTISNLREAIDHLLPAALEAQESAEKAELELKHHVAYLATVAHELRNPLLPLRLAILQLERARTDDDIFAQVQATLSGQIAQIARLIGDLVDGSRVSAGKFRVEHTMVDRDLPPGNARAA